MKTGIIIYVFIVFAISINSYSQDKKIKLNLIIENQEQIINSDFAFNIYNKNDSIVLKSVANIITIADSIIKLEPFKLKFIYKNYYLSFDKIYVNSKSEELKWTIKIDTLPFNKKKYNTIKKWTKIKRIYTLETHYNNILIAEYKKSFPQ